MGEEKIKELQKSLFSKMDKTIQEYINKDDVKRANAFAFKMKEVISSVFEIISQMDIAQKSEEDKDKILMFYHKQMEDMIPKIKDEIEEAIKRENQIPSYIGFMLKDERRLQ